MSLPYNLLSIIFQDYKFWVDLILTSELRCDMIKNTSVSEKCENSEYTSRDGKKYYEQLLKEFQPGLVY